MRLAVLSGPTGVGAAKLLDNVNNHGTANHMGYDYTIASDNSELVAGLSNGEIDIATVASNVAVNLYNKTDGGVQIIAAGTLGVLHILESGGGTSISSMADLAGKTVYAAGQALTRSIFCAIYYRKTAWRRARTWRWCLPTPLRSAPSCCPARSSAPCCPSPPPPPPS